MQYLFYKSCDGLPRIVIVIFVFMQTTIFRDNRLVENEGTYSLPISDMVN